MPAPSSRNSPARALSGYRAGLGARDLAASDRGVIQHQAFAVEPWRSARPARPRPAGTDRVGVRARQRAPRPTRNLDEGEPFGLPGTYLAGFYETRPLPYAEPGYGDPEDGQTVVNVTNGKIIRLWSRTRPSMCDTASCASTSGCSTSRGVLRRTADWVSPTGRACSRLVDPAGLVHTAVDRGDPLRGRAARSRGQVVVQSELVTNETLPITEKDPRAAAALASPLASEFFTGEELAAMLIHTTKASGLTVAAAMDHRVDGPPDTQTTVRSEPDLARLTITATAAPGKPLRMTKFVAYSWSGERTVPALRDQVDAALAGAVQTGWEGLLQQQRGFLDDVLGGRGHRDRRRRGAPAGGPLRAVPHRAGGGARRTAPDSGEGTHRSRL